ncbi:MAG: sigma-54 dependent transcriptional regulator [bacterium]
MSTVLVLSASAEAAATMAEWIRSSGGRCVEAVEPALFRSEDPQSVPDLPENPDCIVVVAGNETGGERVLRRLRLSHLTAGIVTVGGRMFSNASLTEPGSDADMRFGPDVTQGQLLAGVRRALELAKLRSELQYLRCKDASGADFGTLVGSCPAMREVLTQVLTLCRRTVRSRGPAILVTGETGTGKGQIARAIHHNGDRRDKPMVEVNCASLLDTLMESELFGCEKGAFTGAETARTGLFEVAHGGTIFLDEIGTLGSDLQAKLLRFLDERTIRRVGSTVERTLDVQVICATHRDLDAAVRLAEFREDLFYRLSVIHLHLPPLRERERDVLELAQSFLGQLCSEYGMQPLKVSPATEDAMLRYRWPGNVRELRNRLERIVLLCDSDVIEPEHLELPTDPAKIVATKGNVKVEIPKGGISLAEVEKAFIEEAMRITKGNVARAARLLDLSRSTLRYRLKE